MNWMKWVVAVLVVLTGGWMLFDGARALVVGEYVTPRAGEYAGRLGPWSNLVRAAGLDPRSTPMKLAFVIYGLLYLGSMIAWLGHATWARWALAGLALLGFWYLPFGTLANAMVLILLWRIGP